MRRRSSFGLGLVLLAACCGAQATACAGRAAAPSTLAVLPVADASKSEASRPSWYPPEALRPGAIALGEVASEGPPQQADVPPPIVAAAAPAVLEAAPHKLDSSTILDGEVCLRELVHRGIAFHTVEEKQGVKTPVVVDGPLGGVVYRGIGDVPLLCDCRLAVALSWVGPDLLAQGVTEMWFSGAYSYRMARVGRLSLHAWGLAIDVHELTVHGQRLELRSDYERGLADPCASSSALNQVACALRATGLFRELLTPDTDADHYDHFHLSITPLGEDPVRRVPPPPGVASPASRREAAKDAATNRHGGNRHEGAGVPTSTAAAVETPEASSRPVQPAPRSASKHEAGAVASRAEQAQPKPGAAVPDMRGGKASGEKPAAGAKPGAPANAASEEAHGKAAEVDAGGAAGMPASRPTQAAPGREGPADASRSKQEGAAVVGGGPGVTASGGPAAAPTRREQGGKRDEGQRVGRTEVTSSPAKGPDTRGSVTKPAQRTSHSSRRRSAVAKGKATGAGSRP